MNAVVKVGWWRNGFFRWVASKLCTMILVEKLYPITMGTPTADDRWVVSRLDLVYFHLAPLHVSILPSPYKFVSKA